MHVTLSKEMGRMAWDNVHAKAEGIADAGQGEHNGGGADGELHVGFWWLDSLQGRSKM
jgi:hypothetical protein